MPDDMAEQDASSRRPQRDELLARTRARRSRHSSEQAGLLGSASGPPSAGTSQLRPAPQDAVGKYGMTPVSYTHLTLPTNREV